MTRYRQSMREALAQVKEAYSTKQIKMAIGIASDPRYKGGNYTGAYNAIEKIKKGLAKHPQVAAVLKRQNENFSEQPEHEITVGDYTTKHFHMCGSAQTVMKKHADKEGAKELTMLQDLFYKMEMEAMEAGSVTDEQKKKSQILYDKIIAKAEEVGIKDEVDKYMKMHLDSMIKGDPKLGFGRTDKQEALDKEDEPKVKEIIKKLKGASKAHAGQADDLEKAVNEETELDEAKYKYDGKVVKISKKEFAKVSKDYKNTTKGKERMMILDPKTQASISVPVQFEEVELDERKFEAGKSASGYDIFHKDFSSAMQHATAFAKKKGQPIKKDEIDNKVATGPRKPSPGKENSYTLETEKGKRWSVQVYNMGSKFELNMYLTSSHVPEGDVLDEAKEVLSRFKDDKLKKSIMNLATQKGLKVKEMGDKLEVSGNARKVMDLTLAVQKHDVKIEQNIMSAYSAAITKQLGVR